MIYFSDIHVLICLFHRKQALDRWLQTVENGCVANRKEIMVLIDNIAESLTEEELLTNMDRLKTSLYWRDSGELQEYFEKTWEPHLKVSFYLLQYFLPLH